MSTIHIAVTGAAGQIAYSLLFRLAAGELFGTDQKIALHLLEIPEATPFLEGVKMELEDCAFPLLESITIGSDLRKIFEGVNYAFLLGAKPRTLGMERKELLGDNGKIFQEQGKALSDVAAKDIQVLVVGNPCNTNCLIAIHNAKNIAPERFHAMTRLDQNRAASLLAQKADRPVTSVQRMIIWGNHSSTQVPDFVNALIDGNPALQTISDRNWCETEFLKKVQNRGAEILKARGKSSAASAASAAIDAMKALVQPTEAIFSSGVYTQKNSYGIDPDLVFSFPCSTAQNGMWKEVPGISWDGFLEEKIKLSEKELKEER
ncbi:MAG TPA: malate dehydrogenase, partial [Chlamydiales bacterium]|nr:malate dehydrogenase [Chlamydiales bacterium]